MSLTYTYSEKIILITAKIKQKILLRNSLSPLVYPVLTFTLVSTFFKDS